MARETPDRLLRLAVRFRHGSFGPADPIPDWLLPLREKAAAFARLAPDELVQALVIRYDPGAASAGIAIVRSSSMSWAFRSERPPRCISGDAGLAAFIALLTC